MIFNEAYTRLSASVPAIDDGPGPIRFRVRHLKERPGPHYARGSWHWFQYAKNTLLKAYFHGCQNSGRGFENEEDPSGGFRFGGWMVPYVDEFSMREMVRQMSKPFDLLLGRKTYEIFAAYWPNVKTPGDPIAAGLNGATKYVVSKTLTNPG